MSTQVNNKVITATKWSAITEIAAKLVSPVSTMLLARLLTPEAFGVLVTATMIISFSEIFTDAGFQKYLIQKEFDNDKQLFRSTTVAFWSNLGLSIILWLFITVFSSQIARLVGNEGYGLVISISCVCIPLEAFSSIQMALFKRWLDFKTLFLVRIVGISVPIVVTIPLAVLTHSYWSLIIGMIALNASNAFLLTIKSKWKPAFTYDIRLFKQMFAFTSWSMVEAISIWLTGYLDIFFVGTILNTYYMGIYRTSINTVGQIMSIITAATTPVLFSALSRLQDNPAEFKKLFFRFQKMVGLLVVPLGVSIFLFSSFITNILLGKQWEEASDFIGWWGLTSAITIVLSHYCSEVYRSLGKPKLSVLAQWLHLVVLVPVVLISVKHGFTVLTASRSIIRLELILVNLIILYNLTKISPTKMISNITPSLISAISMVVLWWMLPKSDNTLSNIANILCCFLLYFVIIMAFPEERNIIFQLKNILKNKHLL